MNCWVYTRSLFCFLYQTIHKLLLISHATTRVPISVLHTRAEDTFPNKNNSNNNIVNTLHLLLLLLLFFRSPL